MMRQSGAPVLALLCLGNIIGVVLASGCVPLKEKYGVVCVCNATHCDTAEDIGELKNLSEFVYFISSESGFRMERKLGEVASERGPSKRNIKVDPTKTYQTIKGFGNAFTDAAALNFAAMAPEVQRTLLDQYWGSAGGMQYTIGRIPIGSCDFSTHVYSYDDHPGDVGLKKFSIDSEPEEKLALIRRAIANANASDISLFASPWAPPAWMTSTNSTIENPKLSGGPSGAIAKVYAQYLVKFFEAYASKGIQFWGLTAQNEPAGNTGKWQGLKFSAEDQRDFIKNALGPALAQSNITSSLKLMMLDDQRIHLPDWADTVLGDPDAAKYVSGIGLHWYAAVEDSLPSSLYFGRMAQTHEKHPDVFMLATEACEGFLPWSQGVQLGSWARAETYAHDICGDLLNWAVGWVDWNAFLDVKGGPNWAKNVVDAPIILDTARGDRFFKNPMFYALQHFSAFVPPGSVRIHVESTSSSSLQAPMECVGFRRPDGALAIVVLNRGAQLSASTSYTIELPGKRFVNMDVPPHSFQTLIIPMPRKGIY
eukprot:g3135.t1